MCWIGQVSWLDRVEVLSKVWWQSTVHGMYTVSRFLQMVGLAIPPLAIISQLNDPDNFGTGEMLKFLLMAVGIFLLGYLLQRFFCGSQ